MADEESESKRVQNWQLLEQMKTNNILLNQRMDHQDALINQRMNHQDEEIANLCKSVDKALNERHVIDNKITGHEERIKNNTKSLDKACTDIEGLKKKTNIWEGFNTLAIVITTTLTNLFGR